LLLEKALYTGYHYDFSPTNAMFIDPAAPGVRPRKKILGFAGPFPRCRRVFLHDPEQLPKMLRFILTVQVTRCSATRAYFRAIAKKRSCPPAHLFVAEIWDLPAASTGKSCILSLFLSAEEGLEDATLFYFATDIQTPKAAGAQAEAGI